MVDTPGLELAGTILQCYHVCMVECRMVGLEEWLLDAVKQEVLGTHLTIVNAETVSCV